jgi:hypothetical protein
MRGGRACNPAAGTSVSDGARQHWNRARGPFDPLRVGAMPPSPTVCPVHAHATAVRNGDECRGDPHYGVECTRSNYERMEEFDENDSA